MSTHLYKTIFNQMPSSLSIKESEEITKNIMGAIQKMSEVKESAEEVLRKYFKTKDNTDIHWIPEVIQAMQEYALQYQSVQVSEPICTCSQELSKDPCIHIKDAMKKVHPEVANIYREQGWEAGTNYEWERKFGKVPSDVPNKQQYISSFLPKKPL